MVAVPAGRLAASLLPTDARAPYVPGTVETVTDASILVILRGEGGAPAHLHAVFGDASLRTLEGAWAAAGTSLATILRACEAVQDGAAVANPELDALLAKSW